MDTSITEDFFFEGSHLVVYGQLFTILLPSLHNIQNQLHHYNWLHLATCFGHHQANKE